MRYKNVTAILAALTAGTLAHGAGFGIYEWSPSAIATGGTLLGNPRDASAAWLNPAGMTKLDGTRLFLGGTYITRDSTVQIGPYGTPMKRQSFLIPAFYATHALTDRASLGLATTTEYGMGTKFPTDWPGRWSNIETSILSVSISPTFAYAVLDNLSLGAGPRFMYFDFANERNVGVPLELSGDSWGYGGVFSLLWDIVPDLSFGLVYRTGVKQEISGRARAPIPALYGPGGGTLHLPAATTGGLNWQATEKLNLGVSATFTQWSSYDKLHIRINNAGDPDQKSWKNVWRFGAGGTYALTDAFNVMAGYVYDMDPINAKHTDYMLPPGDRHILGTGFSYAFSDNWEFSLGYSFIYMETRFRNVHAPTGASVPSKFKDSNAHMVSTAVSYKF